MEESKSIEDSSDEFSKLIIDSWNHGIKKMEEEDKAVILLTSLPKNLKNFEETLKYGRTIITVDDIHNALSFKLLEIKDHEKINSEEGLSVRGRPLEGEQSMDKEEIPIQVKIKREKGLLSVKCFQCNKMGHVRICPDGAKQDKDPHVWNAALLDDGYENAEVLTFPESRGSQEWVLDFGVRIMAPD